jgi:hypothetical protein
MHAKHALVDFHQGRVIFEALSVTDADNRRTTQRPLERLLKSRSVEALDPGIGDHDWGRIKPLFGQQATGVGDEAPTHKYGVAALRQIYI